MRHFIIALVALVPACFLVVPPPSFVGLACEPDDNCGDGLVCTNGVCVEDFSGEGEGESSENATDVLFVVDNSGSMQEEQDNLAGNFINPNAAGCPIPVSELADFSRCSEDAPPAVCRFANPSQELLEGELAACGFIQILAAFENDFRVGVITTDVGVCDNRFPVAQGTQLCNALPPGSPECPFEPEEGGRWGFRGQRGCLQPNGPPGTTEKFIARADLLDTDPANDDIGRRFVQTLRNIRTTGSPIERGLDAVRFFFDTSTQRGPGCENDLDTFIRRNAKLAVIFLTDEDDCSRLEDDDPLSDDLDGEVCGEYPFSWLNDNPPDACYTRLSELTQVTRYATLFRGLKPNTNDISFAVIGGALNDGDSVTSAGCFVGNAGNAQGGCVPVFGNSNSPQTCPGGVYTNAGDPNNGLRCCEADPGGRYFDLVDQFGGVKGSICSASLQKTMADIAAFIGAVASR